MPVTGERGQSSVEFALVLPLVVLLILALLQVGLLMRDQMAVIGAAREAAREGAVTSDIGSIEAAAKRAAPGLALSLDIERGRSRGDRVVVSVSARPATVPLVGKVLAGRVLKASATMRVERSAGS